MRWSKEYLKDLFNFNNADPLYMDNNLNKAINQCLGLINNENCSEQDIINFLLKLKVYYYDICGEDKKGNWYEDENLCVNIINIFEKDLILEDKFFRYDDDVLYIREEENLLKLNDYIFDNYDKYIEDFAYYIC